MTSIINSTCFEFKVQAYHSGKFVTVTNEDLKGKWAIFFFYPADFTFVCPPELVDMADKYRPVQSHGRGALTRHRHPLRAQSLARHFRKASAKSTARCSQTPRVYFRAASASLSRKKGVAYRGTFVVNEESWWKFRTTASAAMQRIAAQNRRGTVQSSTPGRSMPRQMAAGRRDTQTEYRPGR